MKIEKVKISEIVEYENNAKNHPKTQLEQIKKSIELFGYNDPIAIDENNMIIEGHGRYIVLKELAYDEIEIIRLSHLSETQKKAYIIAHNKINMNTDFDFNALKEEMSSILSKESINFEEFGFNDPIVVDSENVIIEGHGRYLALKEMGVNDVECIKLEHMSQEEIKSYRLIHNKINMNTGFDVEKLNSDLEYLKEHDFDIELTGFTDIEFKDTEDDYDTLDIDDYEDENVYNSQYICPNCNYVGDKKEFVEVYE